MGCPLGIHFVIEKLWRLGFACNGDVLLTHKGTIGRAAILNYTDDFVVLTPQVTCYRMISFIKKEYIKA